ncbi:MAG: DNA repair protein RecO [Ignavibacteriota bacterium]|nr:DNA repair protein RecO [Ignavibacteriota bacterium]
MNNLKTDAFILSGFKYGDTSKIVTLFSEEAGKFSAIVKGVRNNKSKLGGVFENMNHVNVIFSKKENRDLQFISKAECVSSFSGVKDDFDKLMVAYKLLELTSKMMYDYDVSKEVYLLLKDAFYSLNKADENINVIFLMYQIKFAVIQGIDPVNSRIRNFDGNNYVLNDSENTVKRNMFFDENKRKYIELLYAKSFSDLVSFDADAELVKQIQNAYEYHFMMSIGKYGFSKSNQIIDELNNKLYM